MTELDENSLELAARAAYDAAPLVFGSWDRPARGTESSVTTAPVSWDEVQQDAASGDRVCAGVVQDIHRSARAAYEFMKDVTVELISFVDHPTIAMAGASPDGLVGEDGLVEIKCPLTATHLDGLMSGEVDPDYITQIQWQLACTKRQWCDFVSFDPRLPAHLQLFIKRVERDQRTIIELETEVSGFLRELDAQIARLPQAPQEIAA